MFYIIVSIIVNKHNNVFYYHTGAQLSLCDIIGKNQSHVAKHETAQICILSKNVKMCPFFVFIKKEIFVHVCVN